MCAGCANGSRRRSLYLWAAEWHSQGHGLHVHFAVGRYILREWITPWHGASARPSSRVTE